MNTPQTCPQCGAKLPADAPDSLCPACLISGALPSPADHGATMIVDKPTPRALPRPGEIFGGYLIERELGRGGMGAVYAAEHLESGRRVALKVLSHQLDSADARARFLREGRLAASINHPNSVYVFGTEEIDDTPIIAMELIAGGTLQDRIQRGGPLPIGQAVDAVLQIIAGLEAAHSVGILHRDIKPANCFEDVDGTVKIGDFGLSISTAGRGDSMHTIEGTFLGTPAFCSPEQLRGEELNVRSDMYSVGVTLFYLLTGRTPFDGRNMVQLLANSLEKPAPSPVQFRTDIPQGLARIVLRCLNKQATERFSSYHELRQALQPFSSIAPTPATLGLRFGAAVIDHLILSVANFIVPLFFVNSLMDLLNPEVLRSPGFHWLMAGMFVVRHLYFGITEGLWGASAGKALMGLRVATLNRSAPGIPRAFLRSVLLQAFFIIELFRYDIPDITQVTVWNYVWLFVQVLFFALFFITARRQNGFAGLHDLWTGTRVIQKAAYQPRVAMAQAEEPVTTTEGMRKIGPFHVIATLSDTVVIGYDTRLLRQVWIRQTPVGTPPVSQVLRNISRPGRLRWLQGERHERECWDAYEAAHGSPMTQLIGQHASWREVRYWLRDLAAELDAAAKTASLPDTLTLDRVWITTDGRAKLLDFPAPGSTASATEMAAPTPQAFLHQVAAAALEGHKVTAHAAAAHNVRAPLPLPARQALKALESTADLHSAAAQLRALTQQPAEVSRWRRFVLFFGTLMPSLFLSAFMAFGMSFYEGWAAKNPAFSAIRGCLMSYEEMLSGVQQPGLENIPVAEARTAMEIYIGGTYGPIVRDPKQWDSLMGRSVLPPKVRALVEQIVKDHPQPSAEEVQKARALLQPLLDTRVKERAEAIGMAGKIHTVDIITASVLCVYLLLTAFLSLFCAVVFRGGLMMRVLGIAVVSDDGTDASRLRMLWRGLIAWSPILLTPFVITYLTRVLRKAGLQSVVQGIGLSLMTVLLVALGIAVVAARGRGLHDRLARTWLVPR
ncbi:protein kinase domain-containing protein [Prosthecobacter sp.]|uniref:protein kinase domain-containing protein n=1 Tax=Prosthecobacter sp. TaxID=1965333 RepID=UPI003784B297